jgi:hypothetical protein
MTEFAHANRHKPARRWWLVGTVMAAAFVFANAGAGAEPGAIPSAGAEPGAPEAARPAAVEAPAVEAAGGGVRDIATLEGRLRDTGAIGFFTKLQLKSEVDDLLAAMRGYHEGDGEETIDALKERFNLLLLKVLSLLQDEDPPLSRDISCARGRLWRILADPVMFRDL